MREALNSNPMVQIAVIGVLVLIVGLFMMMNLHKGSSSSSSSTESSAAPATSSSSTAGTASARSLPASPDASSASVAPPAAATAAPPVSSATVTPESLIPGPGLPRPVVKAWKGGDAVVLLIAQPGGIDDRLVRDSVRSLSGERGVAVFVARPQNIARYARITQGVGVNRVPALVIVRPPKESGPVPEAQVSYGFRSSQSVIQAVHDALYSGPDDLPYYPR